MSQQNPTKIELRVFAGGLLILSGIVLVVGFSWIPSSWQVPLASVFAVCGCIGLFDPAKIDRVYRVWMLVVAPIGWMVSYLVMAAIYFLVITPIGLLRRLVGADALNIRRQNSPATYWEPVVRDDDPHRPFRQY